MRWIGFSPSVSHLAGGVSLPNHDLSEVVSDVFLPLHHRALITGGLPNE